METALTLRTFQRADLAIVAPWFDDPATQRYLGGPRWPATMLERGEGAVGQEFRGAVQTGVYRYLALARRQVVGYVDCGTFDRCTVYGGEGPDGPIITESIPPTRCRGGAWRRPASTFAPLSPTSRGCSTTEPRGGCSRWPGR
jgi:hypothetical protein